MGNEVIISIVFALILVALGAAWVGGYLDAYQSAAQDVVLDKMGENKASYGLKSNLKDKDITGDKDLNDLQNAAVEGVGGLIGKGGLGEDVGSGVSEGL